LERSTLSDAVGFTSDGARRVAAATQRTETDYVNPSPGRGMGASMALALVAFRAPGGGIASNNSATCSRMLGSGSTLTSTSLTEVVWNNYTTAVGSSALVWATWYDANWRVVGANC
jgi:hypothetical protein